jgi:hypothetical protein
VRREPKILFVFEHFLSIRFFQRGETAHLLFHATSGEHLRVGFVCVLHARAIFEEVEHVGRRAKDAAQFFF